jgi:hypothetical protein
MSARRLFWQGADSVGWTVLVVVAAGLAIGLIVVLHAYERRLISRGLGRVLLGLRIAVVVAVFLALLEPVLVWTTETEQSGRIVVAVDGSQSMDTIDLQAGPAEKLRWARSLGLLNDADGQGRIDRWIAAYEKGEAPAWATSEEEPDPEKRRSLSEGRRQNVEAVLREVDALSRKDIAERLLAPGRSGLLNDLQKHADVEVVVFGGGTVDADSGNLAKTLKQPPKLARPQQTDLPQAINAALARTSAGKLEGIVLVSDGRNTVDERRTTPPTSRVPVYPVLVGSERRPKDLAIAALEAPPSAFLNDKPVIRAALRTSGYSGSSVDVELHRSDRPDLAPLKQTVQVTGPTADVEFAVDADEVGRRRYRLVVVAQPDETRSDNNERQFTLQVVDDQARVLVVDGEPRWEFRYLETALHRDERVKVDSVVFRQPFMGLLPDTFFPRTLPLPEQLSENQESPFAQYDLVIIGDVTPEQLRDESWRWLDRYVREEGGTLVLAAGKQSFPLQHRSEVVQTLLPVVDLRVENTDPATEVAAPRDRGLRWRLTPDGLSLDLLRLAADEAENRDVWSELPGHSWVLIGSAKPAATVWASVEPPRGRPAADWERAHALFAQHYVGAGQVIWLGVDSTWRWRYGVGDAYHHRFWGQLARWAAEFKSAVGNEFVRFGVDRPSIGVNEETTVRARWDAKLLRKFPNLKARARVFRIVNGGEEEAGAVDLAPADGRAVIHEGRLSRLRAGEYRIRLETEGAKVGEEPIVAELLVTEPLTPELADVSASPETLAELARQSNGRLFRIEDVRELPGLFGRSSDSASRQDQVTVWNHWSLLLLLFALLTTEWVLRKLNGLP